VYGKGVNNISFFVGDNCKTNRSIATLTEKPLLGCYSHKFDLAVSGYLSKYEKILDKVNQLMKKLRNVKNRGKLRKLECPYQPVIRNDTRWSSTFNMIQCYLRIRSYIEKIDDDEVLEYLPTISQFKTLEQLMEHLKAFESVTKALQLDGLDLAEARALFDGIVVKYPSMENYLSPRAEIVHSPEFENGVVKILNNEIKGLTLLEEEAVKVFIKPNIEIEIEIEQDKEPLSFAKEILQKKKKKRC